MNNTTGFASLAPTTDALILLGYKTGDIWEFGEHFQILDQKIKGQLSKALKHLTGSIITLSPSPINDIPSIMALGIDPQNDAENLLHKGGELFTHLTNNTTLLKWSLLDDRPLKEGGPATNDVPFRIGLGFESRKSELNEFRASKELPYLSLYTPNAPADLQKEFDALVAGTQFAKKCIASPPNCLTPQIFAKKIQAELGHLKNVSVQIIDDPHELQDSLRMNCLWAVGKGSAEKPAVVIIKLTQAQDNSEPHIALVGKGVTFDSGGLSLKPARSMEGMKGDMAGAAAVVGAIQSLALSDAKVNVYGVVGLVENMPSSQSYKPDDIIRSASGKTVEVLNTDAEGRLVLADLLHYTQNSLNCTQIIDIATLTGAVIHALGHEYAALFSNDDRMAHTMLTAAKFTGEPLYRMPFEKYKKWIKSSIADIKNIADGSRGAGSSMAAAFLYEFVLRGTKWSHIDMAGIATDPANPLATHKEYVGYGVSLLHESVKLLHENR